MWRRIEAAGLSRRRHVCGLALAATLVSATQPSHAAVRYVGVNLAGGEFNAGRHPAIAGKDYIYPTTAIAAPFRDAGMNIVRVPVAWERLQPEPLGPLDEAEMARIDRTLIGLSGFTKVILDVHNYGRYRGQVLSPDAQTAAWLPDLWRRLASRYHDRDRVVFGLMNEPHGIAASDWRRLMDATMAAIRKTGARNLVLVPGTRWSGAHSWVSGGPASNAAAFAGFSDPGHNFAYDLHQYADADSSGTHADCIGADQAAGRLQAATAWLKQQHQKGFLGEFGVGGSPGCQAALDAMLSVLDANSDAWLGWTYWAGGPWWGGYFASVQPKDGQDRPQMAVLRRFVPSQTR